MSVSHSAGVAGGFFRVAPDFMLLCLAKTDDVRLIASLCVCHVHDDALEPTEQADPLLAVGFAVVFPGDDRAVEYSFATNEVQSVSPDVAQPLRFVPGRHSLIVATNKEFALVSLLLRRREVRALRLKNAFDRGRSATARLTKICLCMVVPLWADSRGGPELSPSLSFGTTTLNGIIDLERYLGVYGTTFV